MTLGLSCDALLDERVDTCTRGKRLTKQSEEGTSRSKEDPLTRNKSETSDCLGGSGGEETGIEDVIERVKFRSQI